MTDRLLELTTRLDVLVDALTLQEAGEPQELLEAIDRLDGPWAEGCGFTVEEIEGAPPVEFEPEGEEFGESDTIADALPGVAMFEAIVRDLRKAGVDVVLVKGWRTRTAGGFFDPRGMGYHHTASPAHLGPAPSLGVVTHGRRDLDGPLSNWVVSRPKGKARKVTVYLVAAGRCNHMGEGGPLKGIPRDSGNPYLMGAECENSGTGEKWPDEQREAIAVLFAVCLHHMKRSAFMVICHKEWTPRKIDPFGIVCKLFRDRVRALMRRRARARRKRQRKRRRG